jgi:hypothetical protein
LSSGLLLHLVLQVVASVSGEHTASIVNPKGGSDVCLQSFGNPPGRPYDTAIQQTKIDRSLFLLWNPDMKLHGCLPHFAFENQ